MACLVVAALRALALVWKLLLEQAGLHTPYEGGLGSFKMYVLLYEFLVHAQAGAGVEGRTRSVIKSPCVQATRHGALMVCVCRAVIGRGRGCPP
jgi:DNA polymerase sigma